MKRFYCTSLVYNRHLKQNQVDIITATDRAEVMRILFSKYFDLGFEILKQKIVQL